jgi:hypothetical protein
MRLSLVAALFLTSGMMATAVLGEDGESRGPAVYIKSARLESGSSPGRGTVNVELANRSSARSAPFTLRATDRDRRKVRKSVRFPDGIAPRDRIRQRLEVSLTTVPGQACYVVEIEVPGQETSYWTRRLACTYVRVAPDESTGTSSNDDTPRYRLPDDYRKPVPDIYRKKFEDRQVK